MNRWTGALAAVAVAGAMLPAAAMAHVTKDVADGKYTLELGFEQEPAYVGQPNAIFVRIGEYGTGGTKPVDGLAGSLKAEAVKDGKTMEFPLVPKGEGVYVAPFFPTAVGDYTFRISGEIDGAPVLVEETSSPTTFDPVQPLQAVQFPGTLPDTLEVATQAATAEQGAISAQRLAFAGIAIGSLGVALAGVALARRT